MEKRLRTMITMFGHEYYYEEHFEFWFEVLFVLLMDKLKRFKASMKRERCIA